MLGLHPGFQDCALDVGRVRQRRGWPFSVIRSILPSTAIAAWFGMFATALNLIPGGQLDGGHIVFALWPRWHRPVSFICIGAMMLMSWKLWIGWLLWAVILRMTGERHPDVPHYPEPEERSAGY